jgi:hypothetical protein
MTDNIYHFSEYLNKSPRTHKAAMAAKSKAGINPQTPDLTLLYEVAQRLVAVNVKLALITAILKAENDIAEASDALEKHPPLTHENFYGHCGIAWSAHWDGPTDDECPVCSKECSPLKTTLVE